jgi:RpiR family carbohydrate utilization transcriptional regulator
MGRYFSQTQGEPIVADDTLSALSRAKLRPAERRVAAIVVERQRDVAGMSIAELAATAGVSEPTVLRFCRTLGSPGFPEFKLRLAEGLASGTPYLHRDVALDDAFGVVVDKIFDSTQRALADLRKTIDRAALERAVAMLASAQRIDCLGAGTGSSMAYDAQMKLMRLGVPAVWHPDTHAQTIACSGLGAGDVALVFGIQGNARELLRAARTAAMAGASVIGIARGGARLAECCDVFLAVETAENTEIYTPSQSRIAVLTVLDILATALMVRLGPRVLDRLRRAKLSVQDDTPPAAPTKRRLRTPPSSSPKG